VQLIKKGSLNFFCFFTLSKGIYDVQSILGYVFFRTLFTHSISIQHHVHIRHWKDYDEQKAVVIVVMHHHHQGCQLYAKCASMRKYFRGSGNLCSSAAYSNFIIPFCAVYNRVNTVQYLRDLSKTLY